MSEKEWAIKTLFSSIESSAEYLDITVTDTFKKIIENSLTTAFDIGVVSGKKLTKSESFEKERQDDNDISEIVDQDRSKQLMDMYISEGMMVEDLIEMIVSLEKK
ncbi:hypothetical protein [Lysinibacillus xylanilyticus]|uniref:hypothetical protein n=1 Tax=Lysinibacillus xylanilyticus TaxID=582475 RepID=UPI003D01F0B5